MVDGTVVELNARAQSQNHHIPCHTVVHDAVAHQTTPLSATPILPLKAFNHLVYPARLTECQRR
jgi:hypothetical protein